METVRIKRSLPLEHHSLCLSTSWCGLENLLGQCRLLQPTTQRAAKWIKFLTMNSAAHTNAKYKAFFWNRSAHVEWNTAKTFWIKTRLRVCVAKQVRLTIRIIFKLNYDQRLALKTADECTGFFLLDYTRTDWENRKCKSTNQNVLFKKSTWGAMLCRCIFETKQNMLKPICVPSLLSVFFQCR